MWSWGQADVWSAVFHVKLRPEQTSGLQAICPKQSSWLASRMLWEVSLSCICTAIVACGYFESGYSSSYLYTKPLSVLLMLRLVLMVVIYICTCVIDMGWWCMWRGMLIVDNVCKKHEPYFPISLKLYHVGDVRNDMWIQVWQVLELTGI